jgi:microcystin-dependent protein
VSTPYVGEIRLFAGNFAPLGWALCDGSIIAIVENETLFNLIGTTYGGDGQSTFALPDLRGRAAIGVGAGPGLQSYLIGEAGGVETVTLSTAQLPQHGILASANDRTRNHPTTTLAVGGAYRADADADTHLAQIGGNQPHDNMPPYAVMNFIISLFGIFPSQA